MSQRTRIQTALRLAAEKGRFFEVSYGRNGKPSNVDSDAPRSAPTSVLVNEVDANFGPDTNMGRRNARKRDTWDFKMLLAFEKEVVAEYFEQDMMDTVLSLPAVGEMPSVTIQIADAEYVHPPVKDPGSGSRIEYKFEAIEGRR